ncbi:MULTISPECIES: hypothetical protein [Enterococcus]|uniref:hypothetical protein n=1 Tax=Enterococcus TaxID=1350 RepID=UPI0025892234|nr:hypothetical protein [uncultured Enterococcus sp.]
MKRLWKDFFLLIILILLGNLCIQTVTAEAQNSLTNVQKQPTHQLTVRGRIGEDDSSDDDPESDLTLNDGRKTIVADGSKIGKFPETGNIGEKFIYLGLTLLVLWGLAVKKKLSDQRQAM